RHWARGATQPMVLRGTGALGGDERPRAEGDVSATAGIDGPALSAAGALLHGAVRLPVLPQGGELVLQGPEAGPGDPAATREDRQLCPLRGPGAAGGRYHRRARRGRLPRRGPADQGAVGAE